MSSEPTLYSKSYEKKLVFIEASGLMKMQQFLHCSISYLNFKSLELECLQYNNTCISHLLMKRNNILLQHHLWELFFTFLH
jgi:hypothetical protein